MNDYVCKTIASYLPFAHQVEISEAATEPCPEVPLQAAITAVGEDGFSLIDAAYTAELKRIKTRLFVLEIPSTGPAKSVVNAYHLAVFTRAMKFLCLLLNSGHESFTSPTKGAELVLWETFRKLDAERSKVNPILNCRKIVEILSDTSAHGLRKDFCMVTVDRPMDWNLEEIRMAWEAGQPLIIEDGKRLCSKYFDMSDPERAKRSQQDICDGITDLLDRKWRVPLEEGTTLGYLGASKVAGPGLKKGIIASLRKAQPGDGLIVASPFEVSQNSYESTLDLILSWNISDKNIFKILLDQGCREPIATIDRIAVEGLVEQAMFRLRSPEQKGYKMTEKKIRFYAAVVDYFVPLRTEDQIESSIDFILKEAAKPRKTFIMGTLLALPKADIESTPIMKVYRSALAAASVKTESDNKPNKARAESKRPEDHDLKKATSQLGDMTIKRHKS